MSKQLAWASVADIIRDILEKLVKMKKVFEKYFSVLIRNASTCVLLRFDMRPAVSSSIISFRANQRLAIGKTYTRAVMTHIMSIAIRDQRDNGMSCSRHDERLRKLVVGNKEIVELTREFLCIVAQILPFEIGFNQQTSQLVFVVFGQSAACF